LTNTASRAPANGKPGRRPRTRPAQAEPQADSTEPRKPGPRGAATGDTATGTDELCARLREDIVRCVLPPHARLKFGDLQQRYGAGIGSLREALMQLTAEGMVISESFRGFCVAPISLDDLQDLTELRVEFENRALRASILLGDDQWEARIVAALHMLNKITHIGPDSSDSEMAEWEERHGRFHEALLSACPSRRVMQIRKTLYDQGRRYRNLALARSGAVEVHAYQHQELANLVLARDADAACALMTSHILEAANNAGRLVD